MRVLFALPVVAAVCALSAGCVTNTVVPEPAVARAPPPPAPPAAFYDDLSPYGDWWWDDSYGWVWSPAVGMSWRPYTVGHWLYTTDGWLWMSAEPYGWAVFHYGRWLWLDDAGWVWIPGRVWAPAWVAWRTGPGLIGWAPLGPHAVWVPGRGFAVADVEVGIGPWGWVFVDDAVFLAPNVAPVALPRSRNGVTLPTTTVRHRPEHDGGRVVVRGVAPAHERDPRPHGTARSRDDARDSARDDGRGAARDDVPVRRLPELERSADGRGDLIGAPGPSDGQRARPRDDDAELRPLRVPQDYDVDKRWNDERARATERHEAERRAPPDVRPGDLPQRQQRELDDIEREKERDKKAREKRKATPRKVPKKRPAPAGP